MTDTTDQVVRLERFRAQHPGWEVIAPQHLRSQVRDETDWRALGPESQLVRAMELRDLLDEIEGKLWISTTATACSTGRRS